MMNNNELAIIIEKYLERGFGSMNKNDFEVFIFNELIKGKLARKSDNSISRILKIPESKVKRLRYEAELVYGQHDYKEEFISIMTSRVYKVVEPNKIQFSIKNKALRLYLDDILEDRGSFADSSFNSEIVTITIPDLFILLANFDENEELIEQIQKSLKESSSTFPTDLKNKSKELLKGICKDIANRYIPETVKVIENFVIERPNNK